MAILCLAADEDDLRRRVESIILGFTYDDRPLHRQGPRRGGRHRRPAARRAPTQPRADHRAHAGTGPRRPLRQHRPRLQLPPGHAHGPEPQRVHRHRSRASAPTSARRSSTTSSAARAASPPALTVIVATAQGLKMHGGRAPRRHRQARPRRPAPRPGQPGPARQQPALVRADGARGLQPHSRALREMELLRRHCEDELHAPYVVNDAYARGGEGAEEMARLVVDTIERQPSAPAAPGLRRHRPARHEDRESGAPDLRRRQRQLRPRRTPAAPSRPRPLGLGTLPRLHRQDAVLLLGRRQALRRRRGIRTSPSVTQSSTPAPA